MALAQQERGAFPLEKGTTWVYRAHVKAAQPGSPEILEKDLRWKMTVEDASDQDDVSAALLLGSPWDLAWYTPDVQPTQFLVVRKASRYYFVRDKAPERFATVKSGAAFREEDFAEDLWFTTPLREGDAACPPEYKQSAPMWCWSVEAIAKDVLPAKYRKRDSYQLVYRSNPDHVLLAFTPGVGITWWQYVHHGTTSEATLTLVKFQPGRRNRSQAVSSKR